MKRIKTKNSKKVIKSSHSLVETEKKGVNLCEELFMGHSSEFITYFDENDKTQFTDGFIRYDSYSFDVQIKSSEGRNYIGTKKYDVYGCKNNIIFFRCSNVFEHNPIIEYRLISKADTKVLLGLTNKKRSGFKKFNYEVFKKEIQILINEGIPVTEVSTMQLLTTITEKDIKKISIEAYKTNDNEFLDSIELKKIKTLYIDKKTKLSTYLVVENPNVTLKTQKKLKSSNINGKEINYYHTMDITRKNQRFEIGNNMLTAIHKSDDSYTLEFSVSAFDKNNIFNTENIENFELLLEDMFSEGNENIKSIISDIREFISHFNLFHEWFKYNKLEKYILPYKDDEIEIIDAFFSFYMNNMNKKENTFVFFKFKDKLKLLFLAFYINELSLANLEISNLIYKIDNNKYETGFLGFFLYSNKFNFTDLGEIFECNNLDFKEVLESYFKNEYFYEKLTNKKIYKKSLKLYFHDLIILLAIDYYLFSKDQMIYEHIEKELLKNPNENISFINYVQLKKHANKIIYESEKRKLHKIYEDNKDEQIRLSVSLLLESEKQFKHYKELPEVIKKSFKRYPIFLFYKKQ